MNKINLFLIVLIGFFITSSAFPQNQFEGRVEYKMTSGDDDESTQMSYFVKEGKMKIDVKGDEEGSGSMIFDSKKQKMLILMPEEKMYMEMSMQMMAGDTEEEDAKDFEFRKTGEKKEILGYTCEKWVYKDEDNQVDSWLTDELGSFIFFSGPMESSKKARWQSELESDGYFPMELIVKDLSGNVDSKMIVTAVEKKSLDSSMFEAPAGYQKLQMPGME